MKKWLVGILLLACCVVGSAQTGSVNGWCDLGAQNAITQGLYSSNYHQGISPGCTVTVYKTGTNTLANPIYANAAGMPLGNPFTANTTTGQWLFFGSNAAGVDVVLSGGTAPNNYPAPLVWGTDIFPSGGGGLTSVPFSAVGAGANTNALTVASGGSLGPSGTGTITATSAPSSGLTGTALPSAITATPGLLSAQGGNADACSRFEKRRKEG